MSETLFDLISDSDQVEVDVKSHVQHPLMFSFGGKPVPQLRSKVEDHSWFFIFFAF